MRTLFVFFNLHMFRDVSLLGTQQGLHGTGRRDCHGATWAPHTTETTCGRRYILVRRLKLIIRGNRLVGYDGTKDEQDWNSEDSPSVRLSFPIFCSKII